MLTLEIIKLIVIGITGWGVGRTSFSTFASNRWDYKATKWDARWAVITMIGWLTVVFLP